MDQSGNLTAMGEAILADARQEAARLVASAEREAAAMADVTEQEAARLVTEAVAQTEAAARLEGQRRVAAAQLDAMRAQAEAREAVIQDCLGRLGTALKGIPARPDFAALLEHLVAEAAAALQRPDLVLQVRKEDAAVVDQAWCRRLGARLQVKMRTNPEPSDIEGGVIVSAAEGRLRFDQSFEALRTRHQEALRAIIARELWPSQRPTSPPFGRGSTGQGSNIRPDSE